MSDYSANDLIGIPVYTAKRIPLYSLPDVNSPVLEYLDADKSLGRMFYFKPRQMGKQHWYLIFSYPSNSSNQFFYVPWIKSNFNMSRLKADVDSKLEAIRRGQLSAWERSMESAGGFIKETTETASDQLTTGLMLLGGVYIIGRLISRR